MLYTTTLTTLIYVLYLFLTTSMVVVIPINTFYLSQLIHFIPINTYLYQMPIINNYPIFRYSRIHLSWLLHLRFCKKTLNKSWPKVARTLKSWKNFDWLWLNFCHDDCEPEGGGGGKCLSQLIPFYDITIII